MDDTIKIAEDNQSTAHTGGTSGEASINFVEDYNAICQYDANGMIVDVVALTDKQLEELRQALNTRAAL